MMMRVPAAAGMLHGYCNSHVFSRQLIMLWRGVCVGVAGGTGYADGDEGAEGATVTALSSSPLIVPCCAVLCAGGDADDDEGGEGASSSRGKDKAAAGGAEGDEDAPDEAAEDEEVWYGWKLL